MNTYVVTYREYSAEKTLLIGASTVLAAYKVAKKVMRKKYVGNNEIHSITKLNTLNGTE